jgi:NAD(P)H-hydrate epimerase
MGFEVEALLLWPAEELSGDAAANLERFGTEHAGGDLGARLAGSGAVVDAIFGTGFSGAPRELALAAIEAIGGCGAPVVACDVASGIDASSGEVAGAAVEADLTVSFHAAKLGHLVAPGKWHTGELRVAPIGIPDGAPEAPAAGTIDAAVLELAPRRGPRSTKFSSGQVAIAGGSRGLTGAVQMSSRAAIRAGAGYATVVVPVDLEPIFEAGQPEVMSVGCPGGDGCLARASTKPLLRAFERAAAGVLGPGMGRDPASVELAREVLPAIAAPLVLDADGLNAFAGELGRIAARPAPTVLTPHAGELGRLLGRSAEDVSAHRLAAAKEAAGAAGAVVVLKGDDTIVTDGDRVAVNTVSAPGLATAGTGDVLSGVTAALLARGLEPFAAACAAVIAHARAGRDAAARIGAAELVIATDVIDSIPAGMLPDARVE